MIGADFDVILDGAKRGDQQAFAVLWRDLQPSMLRYLRVIVPDACEDLASETWLEVARGLDRFEGGESGFRSWVFTVARHRVVDLRRREARQPVVPVAPDAFPEQPMTVDAAEAALESISTRAALDLIAMLPPDQADVVALRIVGGLDVAQVAAIVGKKTGTVRVLSHRGLRRLAELFEGAEPSRRTRGVTQ